MALKSGGGNWPGWWSVSLGMRGPVYCSNSTTPNLPQHRCLGSSPRANNLQHIHKQCLPLSRHWIVCHTGRITAKPLSSKCAIGQVVRHGELANFRACHGRTLGFCIKRISSRLMRSLNLLHSALRTTRTSRICLTSAAGVDEASGRALDASKVIKLDILGSDELR